MLKIGDTLFLPQGRELRGVRSGIAIRGPREGQVTNTDPFHDKVEVTWDDRPIPGWFFLHEVARQCKTVSGEEEWIEYRDRGRDLAAARHASSISEALERLGFHPSHARRCFIQGRVEIPFTALAGHTVESFLTWLEKQGYMREERVVPRSTR